MVRPKKPQFVQPQNQRKITSFFSTSPVSIKRPPQHNTGVSPDPKRVDSSTTTTATASSEEQNPYPCRKNLSQSLVSRPPSKLSLGWPRGVLKEKSQVCSGESTFNDLDILFDGVTQTQTKKSALSSLATVSEIKSGKGIHRKGERRGSENVLGRGSMANIFKLRHGSESELRSGKLDDKKKEEKEEVFIFDSSADVNDESEDGKLERAETEGEEEEFPDSTPDLRDKYDFGKLIKGKAEEESTSSDSEDSSDKLGEVNKKEEEDKVFMSSDSEDFCASQAAKLTTEREDEENIVASECEVLYINKLGKISREEEEEGKGKALMLSDVEDSCNMNKCGKLHRGNVEVEEEALILSDLSEDLFDSPQKNKSRISKAENSFRRVDKKGAETDTMKQDLDSDTSSNDECASCFMVSSQGFQINRNDETDRISKGTNNIPKISNKLERSKTNKTQMAVTASFLENSQEIQLREDGIELFPEGTKGLREKFMDSRCDENSTDKTPGATADILEGSQGIKLTQEVITDVLNSSEDAIHNRESMPGTPRTKINGNVTYGSPKVNGGDTPALTRVKIYRDGTPEKKLKGDNPPGILKVHGDDTLVNKFNGDDTPGTPKGKINCDGTSEVKVNGDGTPCTPKGTLNGDGTAEAKIKDDFLGTPRGKMNGDDTPEAKINGDGTPGTHFNGNYTRRTPKTKGAKGEGTGNLSRQEEMDCINILEMFEELSPFKQKSSGSRHIPRLLRDDPTVKKFLAEGGQDEESFSAQGNFGRHLVLAVEKDEVNWKIELELLSPENVKRTCTLAGMWSDTVIRDGDIIHILLTDPVDNHYHIDNNQGLVVVHPDLLLSSTAVVSGVFCRRRAVLSQWHRGTDSSMAMLVGSLVHELFQEAVVDAEKGGLGQLKEGKLRTMIDRLVCRRNVLQNLYCISSTLEALKKDMVGFIPHIQTWCHHYLGRDRQRMAGGSYKWPGKVVTVQGVEENIWSPRFGLKGKIDMVVQVEGPGGPATLPLELKTGRASFSAEHRGQLALYAMMASDRRPDPGVGLLLYLREGAMEEVKASARERRDLLRLRNELAQHLAGHPDTTGKEEQPPLPLPPPIAHERSCHQCPHLVTCATHQVLRGEVPSDPHPMASLVPQHTAHLSPQHLEYFRHWCLLVQMEAGEELGGGGALWCREAARREEKGECLAWLVVASPLPVEVQPGVFLHTLVRGSRHPGPIMPLAGVGLHVGDLVVASSTTALALATGTIQGFKGGTVLAELDHQLQAGPAHYYHLDHFQNANFCRLPMLSLGRLLLPDPRAEALRRLIVDRAVPTFRQRLPRTVLASAPLMQHLNMEQRRAVLRAAAAEDFLLVEGFPGTGKSSTVAALVQVLLLLGRSVLLTAYTNAALDSLLLKLHTRKVDFMRLGRANRIHPDLASHTEEVRTGQVATVEQLAEVYEGQCVVAATCLGLTHAIFTRRTFDVCIIDEAAQVLQVTALAPLFLCSSFLLVGDSHQLPPLVRSSQAVSWGMTETLFERLQRPEATVTLNVQYRMNGPIMALANILTYQGQLRCGSQDLETATPNLPQYQTLVEAGVVSPWLQRVIAPTLEASVVMVDTLEQAKESQAAGKTLANQREAWLVVTVVKTLLKAGLSTDEVGIIAPYQGQVKLVKMMLEEDMKEKEKEGQGSRVEVNTVDQYQGRDKTVIICTFVRCGKTNAKAAGILTDSRRLNVALTRAKRKLILIGDLTTLTFYHPFSCLLDALTPQQVYQLTPGTDGFSWME